MRRVHKCFMLYARFCGLYYDGVCTRHCTALNRKMVMNNELERIWKEAAVAHSTSDQRICPKGRRKCNKITSAKELVSQTGLEPRTSRIQIYIITGFSSGLSRQMGTPPFFKRVHVTNRGYKNTKRIGKTRQKRQSADRRGCTARLPGARNQAWLCWRGPSPFNPSPLQATPRLMADFQIFEVLTALRYSGK
jgi:hypothetical protein